MNTRNPSRNPERETAKGTSPESQNRNSKSLHHGFTLLEVLVATGVLAVMVTILFALFAEGSNAWQMGERRADVNQGLRTTLGMIVRDASLAVIDTNQPPLWQQGLSVTIRKNAMGEFAASNPDPAGTFEELCFVAPIDAGNELTNDTYRALCGVRYYVHTAPVIPGQQPPVLGNLMRVVYKSNPLAKSPNQPFSIYATDWSASAALPNDCYTNAAVIAENVLSFRVQPAQYNAQYMLQPINSSLFRDLNSDGSYRINYGQFVSYGSEPSPNYPGLYVGLCVVDGRTASRINKIGLGAMLKSVGFQTTTNWVTVRFENYKRGSIN